MNRTIILASALLAASAFGCAGNSGQGGRTANDANGTGGLTLANGQNNGGDSRDLAEDAFDDKATGGSFARDRAKAKAQEAREVYKGEATIRLEKANGRIVDAQNKLALPGSRASSDARARVEAAASQRTLVSQQISQLAIVPDEKWGAATKNIDQLLEQLETLVTSAVDGLGK